MQPIYPIDVLTALRVFRQKSLTLDAGQSWRPRRCFLCGKGRTLMSRSHGYLVAARAAQMRCAPIKPQPLRTETLVIGAINGLLLLMVSAGFIVSGVAYAVALSSLARDCFVGQSECAGSGAVRDALWRARDRDAEPR